MTADLEALVRFCAALNQLGAHYLIAGAVASGVHGQWRSTQDLDIVVEAEGLNVAALKSALGPDFDVDDVALTDALRHRRSTNVFYLPVFTIIDLYLPADSPFQRSQMARKRVVEFPDSPGVPIPMASPEDVVLKKLEWFRKGQEVSERQWSDVLGVLKVKGRSLDRGYLDTWAEQLGVADLLARAFEAARKTAD